MLADLKARLARIDVMQLEVETMWQMMLGTLVVEKKKTTRELSEKYGIAVGRLNTLLEQGKGCRFVKVMVDLQYYQ